MINSQLVAYSTLLIFCIFVLFPALCGDGRTSYKDMCIVSIKVHLLAVAISLMAVLLVWAVDKV